MPDLFSSIYKCPNRANSGGDLLDVNAEHLQTYLNPREANFKSKTLDAKFSACGDLIFCQPLAFQILDNLKHTVFSQKSLGNF